MNRAHFLLVVCLLCLAATHAQDQANSHRFRVPTWDRFRGPNGTGIAMAGEKLPLPLDEQNILWKVPVPGDGNGSPVLWGDALFLTSASEDGGQRHLLCLNVKDGSLRWKKTYPGGRAKTHRKNTLASATPCLDGGMVYFSLWDGRDLWLAACDFDGKEVWKQNLGSFTAQHGAGHSPIRSVNEVYLVKDHDAGVTVHAFNAATGKPLWTQQRRAFNACYSTPFVRFTEINLGKETIKTELVVASTAGVTGYDADTGKVNWNWNWDWSDEKKELRTVGSPVLVENMVVATSGDGGGSRCAVALKLGEKGELTNSALAWKTRRLVPYVPTFVAWEGHLYFVNDQGVAGCMVATTGELLWSRRVCGPVTASPILVDGKIIAIDEEGQAVFLAATPKECKVLGKQNLGEPVSASPAVCHGRLFIRGKDHLFCIGATP